MTDRGEHYEEESVINSIMLRNEEEKVPFFPFRETMYNLIYTRALNSCIYTVGVQCYTTLRKHKLLTWHTYSLKASNIIWS